MHCSVHCSPLNQKSGVRLNTSLNLAYQLAQGKLGRRKEPIEERRTRAWISGSSVYSAYHTSPLARFGKCCRFFLDEIGSDADHRRRMRFLRSGRLATSRSKAVGDCGGQNLCPAWLLRIHLEKTGRFAYFLTKGCLIRGRRVAG